jgi:mannose-1-phosphate guanylyltransferase
MSARLEMNFDGTGARIAHSVPYERAMKVYPKNQNRYGVILAGGNGTRLLEMTRRISGEATPKQFCPVIGNSSLLEQTHLRVSLLVGESRILTVLNREHERNYRNLVNGVLLENLLIQPANRGTAPAILYALTRCCDCPKSLAMHTRRCFRQIIS